MTRNGTVSRTLVPHARPRDYVRLATGQVVAPWPDLPAPERPTVHRSAPCYLPRLRHRRPRTG